MAEYDILLSVKEIVKAFGTTRAVDGISFDVSRGEIFGLLGPNGAGKTTTIRMLMGITAPDEGVIDYRFAVKSHSVHKRVGYLPEDRGLWSSTRVLDTITYCGELKGMSRGDARKAGMEWLERLDLGQHTNKKMEELSKGMQQKVQFIVSVLHQPELVVLDEMFDGLDPVNQDLFKEIARELAAGGMTVLLSSHRMNMVEELCDRIFLVNRGKKVLYGNLSQIKDEFGEEKVSVTFKGEPAFFQQHREVQDLVLRPGKAEFFLSSRISPDRFIRQIPESLQVREISIMKPPLHDIFVRTVKEGDVA